jgi:hypothetical protein
MTQKPIQFRGGRRRASLRMSVAAVCVSMAIFSGCAAQQKPKAKAFPWATAKLARPVPLAPANAPPLDSAGNESLMDAALDAPPPPSPLGAIQNAPPRPRVPVAPASQTASARPEAPQIVPQLTAAETTAAQQQTSSSLAIAEKNIAAARGRPLNATQSDLASKVRSFLAEAHEAAHVGDWTRASSAAKKAQVLSEELAGSF